MTRCDAVCVEQNTHHPTWLHSETRLKEGEVRLGRIIASVALGNQSSEIDNTEVRDDIKCPWTLALDQHSQKYHPMKFTMNRRLDIPLNRHSTH